MHRGVTALQRAVGAAILVPLLLFALSFAHDLMRCRVTGAVIQTCVCPDQTQSAPSVDAQSCCQRDSIQAFSAAREESSASASALVAPDLTATSILAPAAPLASNQRFFSRSQTFRSAGPPLVLVKQSFLI